LKVLHGNLLTIPLEKAMLYAEPVYTFREGTASYPILQYVTVALGDSVGIGRSFSDAIASALGVQPPPPGNGQGNGGDQNGGGGNNGGKNLTVEQKISQYLSNAQASFEEAQHDLQNGDLGGYQAANSQGLEWLNKAIELRDRQQTSPSTGPTPTSPTGSTPAKAPN
jgi:uncharacterized membrane protein (UPF0182 family)